MFSVRTVGLEAVILKAKLAPARVLENNVAMVEAMLSYIKPIVAGNTPLGPGHFGYHLRDMFKTDVKPAGLKTIGVLKSPPTGYWREFGTLGSFTKGREVEHYVQAVQGNMGERAFMTAHKTLSGTRRLINTYYGGLARWWRS